MNRLGYPIAVRHQMKLSTCAILPLLLLLAGAADWGCYYSTALPVRYSAKIDSTDDVFKVETRDGRTVRFDCDRCEMAHLRDTAIIGVASHRGVERIPLSDVQVIHVRHMSIPLTIIGTAATTSAFFFGLWLALYTWPGG